MILEKLFWLAEHGVAGWRAKEPNEFRESAASRSLLVSELFIGPRSDWQGDRRRCEGRFSRPAPDDRETRCVRGTV